ncbi:vacuolar protein sorting-associated protein 11 [Venturia nashicola]|uniref:E3 ubiquitin-protein ligase PEP5 n=1 Tax=Venturia nashicola TaxID=86259 RepID=A0A4Z1PAI5_9PEZI|nr:vacuolar protein sorting-associated protein 11 [Venturia nashicola]
MALSSWKAFRFFDVTQVKLSPEENAVLSEPGNIECVATGSDNVFFGSSDGVVRILSQSFKIVRSFKAHETGAITFMKQVQGSSLLVTIAEDMPHEPVLKVWALDKLEKKTGIPRCVSTLLINNGRKPFPISAFTALEDLSQLAIGFGNGSVTVVRGDLIHDRGAKQRTVFESDEPITGIGFREGSITTLYIATTGRISTLVISGRGQGQPARSLEETGSGVGCMTVDKTTRDVVVARNDGIYYYGLHGRGPAYAFEGEKKSISIFKDYIALVSPSKANTLTRSTPLRAFGGSSQADNFFSTSGFTILHTDLKFIAHQESLSSDVKFIFMEWGDLFVFTLDGKMFRYHEKTIQQKLEILYQRHLYVLAINLAQKLGVDHSQQNIIYRKYGDFLYQKGDYDTAMQQYLKAIDNTEPSQVIRKFLDTQRIHNLIDYLEELHDHEKATPDHTTLLLNCYAKLKDVDKLNEFIKSPGDLKFDLDTAISMCRQGGYFDQAAYLARKHDQHELVVDILVEDSKKYDEAVAYIWRLEPKLAFENLMKYATVLLEHCSKDVTRLFIDYYTGQFRPKKDAIVIVQASPTTQGGIARATTAVQNLAAMLPLPYMSISGSASSNTHTPKDTVTQVVETNTDDPPPIYDIPKPRTAFSAFVDHPQEFIVFLEACIAAESLKEADKSDLYSTLFEMYLHTANGKKDDGDRLEWENKAKALIEDKKVPIDTSSVLLLSHLENFRDGTILVREKQGLRFDIFRSYTTAKDTSGAIKALHKYGAEEPQLYPAALAYFTSSPEILQEAGDELDAVLTKIDEDGLMAPLQVIQTLSSNGVATMGLVKAYLSTTISRERQEITSNRRLITSYRTDTTKQREEISRLSSKPETFNATRCSACGATLDLPTVHFLCKHSFHERCVNSPVGGIAGDYGEHDEATMECPLCSGKNATVKAIRKAQEESADRHDMFQDALARSRDKFGTISEWLGRGVMASGVEQ